MSRVKMLRKKAGIRVKPARSTPQGLKPAVYYVAFTARLKSCPDASCNPGGVSPQQVKPVLFN